MADLFSKVPPEVTTALEGLESALEALYRAAGSGYTEEFHEADRKVDRALHDLHAAVLKTAYGPQKVP